MNKIFGPVLVLAIILISTDAKSIIQSRGTIKHVNSDLRQDSDEPIYGNNIPGHEAQIAHQYFEINPTSYDFGYLQTDLQRRNEKGTFEEDPETKELFLKNVKGSYKYVRPDGKWQKVEYEADENGFRPIITVTDDEPVTDDSVFEILNGDREKETGDRMNGNSENHVAETTEKTE